MLFLQVMTGKEMFLENNLATKKRAANVGEDGCM
jgi:hypothetical protein